MTTAARVRRMRLRKIRRGLHPRHVHIVLVAVVVEIGMRITKLPRLTKLLRIRLGTESQPPEDDGALDPAVDRWIRVRAKAMDRVMRRWPWSNSCLRRALVLGFLIRRYDPTLLIGVRHDETGQVAAHAWLVVAGTSLDPGADSFLTFGGAEPEPPAADAGGGVP